VGIGDLETEVYRTNVHSEGQLRNRGGFEVLTAVSTKMAVFNWEIIHLEVTPTSKEQLQCVSLNLDGAGDTSQPPGSIFSLSSTYDIAAIPVSSQLTDYERRQPKQCSRIEETPCPGVAAHITSCIMNGMHSISKKQKNYNFYGIRNTTWCRKWWSSSSECKGCTCHSSGIPLYKSGMRSWKSEFKSKRRKTIWIL
jgi:hypothetical protein